MSTILIIATAADRMGAAGHPTGVWLDELATPWLAFRAAGHGVEIATIAGRPIPVDPKSEPQDEAPEALRSFRARPEIAVSLDAPAALVDLDPTAFGAVFVPGGHGAMWDLAGSPALARFLARAWAAGAVLGAVCHGPAALVGVELEGRPLVAGRRVSAFTDSEERATGLEAVVPFLLESRLRALGARVETGPDWEPHALRDGRLVTGQNPASSAAVAAALLAALAETRAAA
ncbi:type 1 glutamine amidotransferase domain-containing protein [Paralimibaculum aggregatum]|uniref:Type 1 glutamine amidotransferase domain-containing protein n=1 Tax=Paralimibaculum aggregatum TaxID=3036245 RepID=A0ABQ6LKC9_9RHOB|nr:type 1 glutamine amidotransferase domain-containing protein [Limibaculum sp. NKW23]GMG82674.1 type 1 glutamine amidotransferase domain-containing protein [Limibaculum sp. NKW23]